MAWNKPIEKKVERRGGGGERNLSSSSFNYKALIAGLVVVLVGGLVVWLFSGGEKQRTKDEAVNVRAQIAEATPNLSTNLSSEAKAVASAKKAEPKELPPQQVGETRNGMIMLCDGRLHRVKGVITNANDYVKAEHEIFDHFSENEIAGLLAHDAGMSLVGSPMYNGAFTEDFLKSLRVPIIVRADDDEYTRNLKKLVTEAKIELKAAYDRGEDIEKLLDTTRDELRDLARYRNELESMTIDGIDAASTPEEVNDYIDAANKMLEEKGIAPLDLSPLAKLKLRMTDENEEEE